MLENINIFSFQAINLPEIALRLIVAAILGGLLGLERQHKHKPLGIRPFVLVATGSCLAVLATIEFGFIAAVDETLSVDPAKVIGGILGGIGFLGAGALFRGDNEVKGAATAASIWLTGGVGIACGIGYIIPAIIAVSIALLTLLNVSRENGSE